MRTGAKKILVVASGQQDHFPVVFMLMRFGHEVRYLLKAQKALRQLETESFDLAIINDQLPDMNVIEFLKKFPEEERQKIIFLCYQPSEDNFRQIMNLGVCEIVSENINPIKIGVAVCDYFVGKTENQNLQVQVG